jgi:hypothetical protein
VQKKCLPELGLPCELGCLKYRDLLIMNLGGDFSDIILIIKLSPLWDVKSPGTTPVGVFYFSFPISNLVSCFHGPRHMEHKIGPFALRNFSILAEGPF